MARHPFGGTLADYVVEYGGGGELLLSAGTSIQFYNAETGGTLYATLKYAIEDVDEIDTITSDAEGGIPTFYGPEDVLMMWADASAGVNPRRAIFARDFTDAYAEAFSTSAGLTAHVAAANPHGTTLDALADVNAPTPADGDALKWDEISGMWISATISAISAVTLNTEQTITAHKTFRIPDGDTTNKALTIQVPAGDRAAAVNVMEALLNEGTDGSPSLVPVFYLNEYGEVRVIPSATSRVAMRIKLRAAQTADAFQVTESDGTTVLANITSDGRVRAPNISSIPPFGYSGPLTTGVGAVRWYNDTGKTITIRSVRASVGTAPTGASIIIDVNKNGTTIFTTQANRPTIAAAGNTSGAVTTMDVTTVASGDYLTVDVDQIGSTNAGGQLSVQILGY